MKSQMSMAFHSPVYVPPGVILGLESRMDCNLFHMRTDSISCVIKNTVSEEELYDFNVCCNWTHVSVSSFVGGIQ